MKRRALGCGLEIIEGTPEELREFNRKMREERLQEIEDQKYRSEFVKIAMQKRQEQAIEEARREA